ncbi:hypothetical protein A5643_10965 [Mycobacterium sp. 1274756.6]|nr:hypothetical protein A5643_10965 [Mycobacterium sp. 1274756.6]
MIQRCSQCGTRWNVRDRQRQWCPRCRGALLPPRAEPPAPPPRARAPRVPAGYRWIAVRPGAPPARRPRRAPRGPTPRYAVIPRWGLTDRIDPAAAEPVAERPQNPATVRRALQISQGVLALAAGVYLLQYALLILNRGKLFHPAVAIGEMVLAVLASAAALTAIIVTALLLTGWLIARRRAAFDALDRPETRSRRALRAGCLVPLANLFWAPVYVTELAELEQRQDRLRKPIRRWWLAWIAATGMAIFATLTRWVTDAQGIGNNTVAMVVAYVLGWVALRGTAAVFDGFERSTAVGPAHRWVVVGSDRPGAVEPVDDEPAA